MRARPDSIPAYVYVLGWLALVAIQLVVVFAFARPLWRAHEAHDWIRTTCTVADADLHNDNLGRGSTERLRVSYSYTVGGATYFSDRVDFSVMPDARRFAPLARAHEGMTLPCWYDPEDPSSAVLDRNGWPDAPAMWLWLAVPLVFGGVIARGLAKVTEGSLGVAVLGVHVLPVIHLAALAWLAPSGGAAPGSAVVLAMIAIGALAWAVHTARAWRRDRPPTLAVPYLE